ncbi:MAG: hypothetical protein EA339_08885 [Rhodobacteraceae bacterium]|nr:MAG: hypothetical protein EA339_08885 [Paracoccaceae bacterium]
MKKLVLGLLMSSVASVAGAQNFDNPTGSVRLSTTQLKSGSETIYAPRVELGARYDYDAWRVEGALDVYNFNGTGNGIFYGRSATTYAITNEFRLGGYFEGLGQRDSEDATSYNVSFGVLGTYEDFGLSYTLRAGRVAIWDANRFRQRDTGWELSSVGEYAAQEITSIVGTTSYARLDDERVFITGLGATQQLTEEFGVSGFLRHARLRDEDGRERINDGNIGMSYTLDAATGLPVTLHADLGVIRGTDIRTRTTAQFGLGARLDAGDQPIDLSIAASRSTASNRSSTRRLELAVAVPFGRESGSANAAYQSPFEEFRGSTSSLSYIRNLGSPNGLAR